MTVFDFLSSANVAAGKGAPSLCTLVYDKRNVRIEKYMQVFGNDSGGAAHSDMTHPSPTRFLMKRKTKPCFMPLNLKKLNWATKKKKHFDVRGAGD